MKQRRTEFIETEQLERAASVIVEHTEIVGFPDIPLHEREMRTIAFLSKTDRNLVGYEFLDPLLPIGVGLDQARINCESFTTDKPLLDAAAQDALEHATEEIALSEAAMPVLGERRVIRHHAIQTEPAEPPVGQIEVDLITQAPLRSDAEAVSDQEHPNHELGIAGGSTDETKEA